MKKRATLDHARNAIALCKKYKIKTYGLYLIGLPWETKPMIEDTINFMQELNTDFVDVNIAYPLPGTEYYRIAKEMNLFNDEDLGKGDYSKPIGKTITVSSEELVKLRSRAILSFYLRPKFILKTLSSLRSPVVLKNYFRSGLRVLKMHVRF